MNTQKAYIEGFVKRAAEYGYEPDEAFYLLKLSTAADAPLPPPPGLLDRLQNFGSRAASALTSAGQGMQNLTGGVKAFGEGYDKLKDSFNTVTGRAPAQAAAPAPKPMSPSVPAAQPASNPALSLGGGGNVSLTPLPAPSAQSLKPATLSLGGDTKVSLNTPSFQQPMSAPSAGFSGSSAPAPAPAQLSTPRAPMSSNNAPMPVSPSSPTSAARAATGPSDAQLAKIMGSYDPRSRLDQAKAQRIREMYSQGITSPREIYADKAYSGITPQSIRRAPQQQAGPSPQMPRPTMQNIPTGVNPNAFSGTQRLSYR
jgi:hypothetical protein